MHKLIVVVGVQCLISDTYQLNISIKSHKMASVFYFFFLLLLPGFFCLPQKAPPPILQPIIDRLKNQSVLSPPLFVTSPSENNPASAFCPWGICNYPGFLFGAFFRIGPETSLLALPPSSPQTKSEEGEEEHVVLVQRPAQIKPIKKQDKTVVYLIPQQDSHTYKLKHETGEEEDKKKISKSPYDENQLEFVYLDDEAKESNKVRENSKFPRSVKPEGAGGGWFTQYSVTSSVSHVISRQWFP
jgi:hypothetical protein